MVSRAPSGRFLGMLLLDKRDEHSGSLLEVETEVAQLTFVRRTLTRLSVFYLMRVDIPRYDVTDLDRLTRFREFVGKPLRRCEHLLSRRGEDRLVRLRQGSGRLPPPQGELSRRDPGDTLRGELTASRHPLQCPRNPIGARQQRDEGGKKAQLPSRI